MIKNHEIIWNNCLTIIKDNISIDAFEIWFKPIKPVKIENDVLTIQVPTHFFYEWLEQNYIDILKKTIKKELGLNGKLEYVILMDIKRKESMIIPTSNSNPPKNPQLNVPLNINSNKDGYLNPFIIPGLKKITIDPQLMYDKTFDNFIEGECNRLARNAGMSIANNPGKTSFNPFLLYSSTGLGKTHLVNAIGVQVKNNFPNKTVLYVHATKFMQQCVDALTKNKNVNDFINFYQLLDVLIIDDVHSISNKGKLQEVFFDIFNHLHQNNKQIILTTDRPIVEIKDIDERIISRFKWGLTADIQPPDFETRYAIIKNKIYNYGIEFPIDVMEYLALTINTHVRELEGVIISLIAQATFNKREVNLGLAKEVVDKFIIRSNTEISINYIQKTISEYFGISVDQLHSNSRKREIVQARQIAMYFSKRLTKLSLSSIGMQSGKKDHATVMHSCKTVLNLIETDKKFKGYILDLRKKFEIEE